MLGVEFRVDVQSLERLAARLDRFAAQSPGVVERVVAEQAQRIPTLARRSAMSRLPRRGGLNALVARSDMPVRVTRRGRTISARVMVSDNAVKDPGAIDRGRVRHPLYGRRRTRFGKPTLYVQQVRPHWFTEPARDNVKAVRAAIEVALREELKGLKG